MAGDVMCLRDVIALTPEPAPRVAVARLLFACCPAAVQRCVRSVVVNAVEAVLRRWSFPHVGQKPCEVIEPFVAHGYSAPAVPFVSRLGAFIATAFHLLPDFVLRRLAPAMRSVPSPLQGRRFAMQAPTTPLTAGSQRVRERDGFVPAVAPTTPAGSQIRQATFRSCNDNQSSESLADAIIHARKYS